MKINLIDNELYITPETDFEEDWIRAFWPGKITRKYGATPADLIGFKIPRADPEDLSGTAFSK